MARRPDLGYFDEGLDLTAAASYAGAHLSFGEASYLPPVAYRSLEFMYLEDEAVWTRSWVAVGTSFDIPEDGDLLPYTLGYHGIHVQRMPEGNLEGRFNLAQHGGCRIVPAQCQMGTKTKCSFTSCGYSRDRAPISFESEGENQAAMYQYLGLRPERLYPVSVAEQNGLIFVNVDPAEDERDEPSWPIASMVDTLPEDDLILSADREWKEIDANWKIAAQRLARVDRVISRDEHMLHGTRLTASGDRIDLRWLYPNLVVLTGEETACVVVVQPTAIERSLLRVMIVSAGADANAWSPEIATVGQEAACLQKSLRSDRSCNDDTVGEPDFAAWWGQQRLLSRIAVMPQVTTSEPMFRSVEHYLI